jgi:hypothetical protein
VVIGGSGRQSIRTGNVFCNSNLGKTRSSFCTTLLKLPPPTVALKRCKAETLT